MTIDLRAPVEAAAEYQFGLEAARLGIDATQVGQAWDDAEPIVKHAYRESVLGPIAAAAPVIEAQVRAQVAAEIVAKRDGLAATVARVEALAELMAQGPDRSGEPPLVTQAWVHAADALRAAIGPRDHRAFLHCGFAESHEPHADRDTYCDGSSAALDVTI